MKQFDLIESCDEQTASSLFIRLDIEQQIKCLQSERTDLEKELQKSFLVELSITDILMASATGIVAGTMNGLFKTHVPKHGKFKHEHSITKTAIDYKVPKPEGMKGSVQGLHRQIGPGHDLGRFKEALDLMSGKIKNFPLWGKTIVDQTGGVLHPGNVKVADFNELGGFKIPNNPAAELMNHLLIDFFTKMSLPLPFTSYIADSSPDMAKIMLGMYGNGLNLKTLVGDVSSIAILHLIIHSYVYLFIAAKSVDLYDRLPLIKNAEDFKLMFNDLCDAYKNYLKSKEFNVLQAIAHGASFLFDTLVTTMRENYAGIFSLDYATLILFSTDVIKYVKKSNDTQNKILSEITNVNERILFNESLWYDSFKKDMIQLATKDGFYDTFNHIFILEKHNEIIDRLSKGEDERRNLIDELQEWNLDENI